MNELLALLANDDQPVMWANNWYRTGWVYLDLMECGLTPAEVNEWMTLLRQCPYVMRFDA